MILLDTHVWVWWVLGNRQLPADKIQILEDAEETGLGVSIMSCWEVAKLVELGRLTLPVSLEEWIDGALGYPGIQLLDLTVESVIEATRLPGDFHRDPVDQLLVATARSMHVPLATADARILHYEHVETTSFKL